MKRGGEHRATRDGMLLVMCWCEQGTVRATPDEIRRGQTHSCGRWRCRPPVDAKIA